MAIGSPNPRIQVLWNLDDVLMTPEEIEAERRRLAEQKDGAQMKQPDAPHVSPETLRQTGVIPFKLVVTTCTILGTICVISSVLRTWCATPGPFDWFVLAMGVLLCGLPLFRKVAFGTRGFEAEIEALKSQFRQLSSCLKKE